MTAPSARALNNLSLNIRLANLRVQDDCPKPPPTPPIPCIRKTSPPPPPSPEDDRALSALASPSDSPTASDAEGAAVGPNGKAYLFLDGMPISLDNKILTGMFAEKLLPPMYLCSTCDTFMNGPDPWDQHVEGQAHNKKRRLLRRQRHVLQGFGNESADDDDAGATPNGGVEADVRARIFILDGVPVSPRDPKFIAYMRRGAFPGIYICSACRKFMTGYASYASHIRSAQHDKMTSAAGPH